MSKPMIVAWFVGQNKPTSVSEILEDFVEEMHECIYIHAFNSCLCKGSEQRPVSLHSVVFDTPAQAFVKNIKGHNSLNGCEHCLAKGVSISSRTTFNSSDSYNAEKRCSE